MPKFLIVPLPPTEFVNEARVLTFPAQSWLEKVQQWLSSSGPPKAANSAGTPIQIQGLETDGVYLYVCTSQNQWRRVLLSNF